MSCVLASFESVIFVAEDFGNERDYENVILRTISILLQNSV